MVLIRYILIFLLLYFLVNLIGKMLFPKRNEGRMHSDNASRKKEGEVHVHTGNTASKKRIHKNDGEYVNFEEITKEDES